jgi:hypothetical protein
MDDYIDNKVRSHECSGGCGICKEIEDYDIKQMAREKVDEMIKPILDTGEIPSRGYVSALLRTVYRQLKDGQKVV